MVSSSTWYWTRLWMSWSSRPSLSGSRLVPLASARLRKAKLEGARTVPEKFLYLKTAAHSSYKLLALPSAAPLSRQWARSSKQLLTFKVSGVN